MTALMTPQQEQFLREHHQAVLGTGRRDGSPQLSTMGYLYDGACVYMSVTTERAKWHNVGRQPRVAMLVNEGRRQLVLYGRAERIHEDPQRLTLTRMLFGAVGQKMDQPDADLARELDAAKRVILKITPQEVMGNT